MSSPDPVPEGYDLVDVVSTEPDHAYISQRGSIFGPLLYQAAEVYYNPVTRQKWARLIPASGEMIRLLRVWNLATGKRRWEQ